VVAFRARLLLTRLILERRYDAPPEFTSQLQPEQLGLSMDLWDDDRRMYIPSPHGLLARILRPRDVSPEDVFIDFGCGTGRVVLEAARRYPFRRVIGVDFVPRLTDIARETVDRNRDRLRCRDVELVTQDVFDYEVPDDATVAYLFDPFRGRVFDTVIAKLIASVDRNPRRLRLIYVLPREIRRLEATGRVRLVRHGRRMVRRWLRADYLALYEILPAHAVEPSSPGPDAAEPAGAR
jgi:SAM-dependent methyltransferase